VQPVLQASAAALQRSWRTNTAAGPRRTDALALALLPVSPVLLGQAGVGAVCPAGWTAAPAGFAERQAAVVAGVRESSGQEAHAGVSTGCPPLGTPHHLIS